MKRLAFWIVAAMFVAAASYGVIWYRKAHAQPEAKYRTAKADRGHLAAKVTATGTLSARVTVQVGSQVSGRLQEIFVDFNSQVKKGQTIATIDPRIFKAELGKARANYEQSGGALAKTRVVVSQAERALARAKQLKDEGLLGQADLEVAQANLDAAKADVVVAQGGVAQTAAQLNESEVNLGFTTIVSPIDGIVISRNVDVGQTVAASLQAPVLFTIAQDLRVIQVDTFVAEADVGKVREGMDTTFTVDAYPGQHFAGKVRMVRNASQTTQNVVTYDAVIDVDNGDLRLKPGMTANVTFVYADKPDVLRVANAALRFRPTPEMLAGVASQSASSSSSGSAPSGVGGGKPDDSGWNKRVVWALRDGQPVAVHVEIGVSDGTSTEVTGGELKPGDDLIVELAAPAGGASAAASGGSTAGLKRVF